MAANENRKVALGATSRRRRKVGMRVGERRSLAPRRLGRARRVETDIMDRGQGKEEQNCVAGREDRHGVSFIQTGCTFPCGCLCAVSRRLVPTLFREQDPQAHRKTSTRPCNKLQNTLGEMIARSKMDDTPRLSFSVPSKQVEESDYTAEGLLASSLPRVFLPQMKNSNGNRDSEIIRGCSHVESI